MIENQPDQPERKQTAVQRANCEQAPEVAAALA